MIDTLLHEMDIRRNYLSPFFLSAASHTLYFGGGTPSVLTAKELELLVDKSKEIAGVNSFDELSLEANPDDLTPAYLAQLAALGINRLSIGVQSFYNTHLQWMRRRHTAQQAIDCIKNAQREGFNNITIDLMYGLPILTLEEWRNVIEQAIALDVPHISAYHLSIEPATLLGKQQKKGTIAIQNEQAGLEQFHLLRELLTKAGYKHYEVSNFARQGWSALHNSAYWRQQPYLGIGPSAHSFDGQSRQWNIANNIRYIRALEKGDTFFEREILTAKMRYNEYLLTTLRTAVGADMETIASSFGEDKKEYCLQQAQKFIQAGQLQLSGSNLKIPPEYFFISDRIIEALFVE